MNLVISYNHKIYCEILYKLALSGEDDKRLIDGINTYAYGHHHYQNLS